MKRILLLLTLFLLNFSYSQENKNNYEVVKTGNKYSVELIKKAFSSANLCGSYFYTKRNIITLDDGAVVSLYSKAEITVNSFSDDCFVSDNTDFSFITWSISSNGYVLKGYQARPSKITFKQQSHE